MKALPVRPATQLLTPWPSGSSRVLVPARKRARRPQAGTAGVKAMLANRAARHAAALARYAAAKEAARGAAEAAAAAAARRLAERVGRDECSVEALLGKLGPDRVMVLSADEIMEVGRRTFMWDPPL